MEANVLRNGLVLASLGKKRIELEYFMPSIYHNFEILDLNSYFGQALVHQDAVSQ